MKYYYEPSGEDPKYGVTYYMDHPLFDLGTLYSHDEFGLLVVQLSYDKLDKSFKWGPLSPTLAHDIFMDSGFDDYFAEHAKPKTVGGEYPVVNVRKLMWALRMKPLHKEPWEQELQRLL